MLLTQNFLFLMPGTSHCGRNTGITVCSFHECYHRRSIQSEWCCASLCCQHYHCNQFLFYTWYVVI